MAFLASLAARAEAASPAELAVIRVAFHGLLAGRPARGSLAMDEGSGALVVVRGLSRRPALIV